MLLWKRNGAAEATAVLLVALAFCITYGLLQGQDINWDLKNYHLYSVYALLEGRVNLDVAAGQRQTWTNPFSSFLPYFLVLYVKPIWGSVILSALSALNIWMVYLIARRVFTPLAEKNATAARWLVAVTVVPAALAPVFLSVVGTTFNDNLVAFLVLAAVFFALQERLSSRSYILAGAFLGLAAAVKLTAVVYVAGFAVAVIFINPKRFYQQALVSMAGFLLAFLPIGGAWMLYVYRQFGNPVFPLYNNVFKSPFFDPVALKDNRFIYQSAKDFLEKPIEMAIGLHPGIEVYMLDGRYLLFLVVFLLSLPLLIGAMVRWKTAEVAPVYACSRSSLMFLIIFVLVNYIVWGLLFGIMRYAVALEQLMPLCIILLLALIASEWRRLVLISAAASVIISFSGNDGSWGRTEFEDEWFVFDMPTEVEAPNTLFVILPDEGISFLAPYLPESDRFVRVGGNMALTPETGLGQRALKAIQEHAGPIRTLSIDEFNDSSTEGVLADYGLKYRDEQCLPILTNAGRFSSCPLTKLGQADKPG